MVDKEPSGGSQQQATFSDQIKDYLDGQFSNLKAELAVFGDCPKAEKTPTFKYPGNQKQFEFNAGVLQEVRKLKRQFGDNVPVEISNIEQKLLHRNKLIRLADKSKGGWGTVDEYEADELASDSDDDRKLRKAEKAAIKKKAELSKKHKPFKYGRQSFPARPSPYFLHRSQPPQQQQQLFRASKDYVGGNISPGAFDMCFACGGYGHWRRNCRAFGQGARGPGPNSGATPGNSRQ